MLALAQIDLGHRVVNVVGVGQAGGSLTGVGSHERECLPP